MIRKSLRLTFVFLIFICFVSHLVQAQQVQPVKKNRILNLGTKYCDIKTKWLSLYNRLGPGKVCIGRWFRVRVEVENIGKQKCGTFRVILMRTFRSGSPGQSNEKTSDSLFGSGSQVGDARFVKILNPGATLTIKWNDRVRTHGDYRYKLSYTPTPDKNYKNHSSKLTIAGWHCARAVDK